MTGDAGDPTSGAGEAADAQPGEGAASLAEPGEGTGPLAEVAPPAEEPSSPIGEPQSDVASDPGAGGEGGADPQPDAVARAEGGSQLDEAVAALPSRSRLPSIIESLLFATDRPLTAVEMAELLGEPDHAVIEGTLAALAAEWSSRGVQLSGVAGGWQFRTHPANAAWVQRLLTQKPVRLTRSQLETLAIAAYRQPVTRPEIDEIRGVDSGGTLKTLLDRQLVRILGKREEPGRPLLYGTTREFLEFFNLDDLKQLPTLREFHELSDEHRAQVEALEQAAPPGSIIGDGQPDPPATPPPLLRVDLSDAPLEEDMSEIDELIGRASDRAKGAADALGVGGKEPPSSESGRPQDDEPPPPPES